MEFCFNDFVKLSAGYCSWNLGIHFSSTFVFNITQTGSEEKEEEENEDKDEDQKQTI